MSGAREQLKIDVLGVAFDNLTMDEAVTRARALMAERRAAYVVTPNPEIVMACRADSAAREAVAGAALTIADGIGVIYGAKLLKTPLKEKIPGIDFTGKLLERMAEEGGKTLFLLGGKPGIAEAAARKLIDRYPGVRVVGTNDGYFSEEDNAPLLEKINAAAPDLLLVCLGAPKQEKWMHANAGALSAGLMIGAGGSMDVFAGAAKLAPERWRKAGLEWLYRLLREPKRIGRMMALPKFLICVLMKKK